MNAIQLNAELYRAMSEVADDEDLLSKILKYVKKLAAKKKEDHTLMTKEEFFRRVDEGREQIRRGEYSVMLPGENLEQHLRRLGYDI